MLKPVPFGIMSYQSRALPHSAQRLVNWYPSTPFPAAQTKTPIQLMPRPGHGAAALTGSAGRVRGMYVMRGRLFLVVGETLYVIFSDGTTSSSPVAIAGSAPVFMDSDEFQLTIVDTPNAWVYDDRTDTLSVISDPDFPGSSSVSFLDGFFIHTVPDTGEFFVSNVGDAQNFDALDFATAESDGDLLVRGISHHREFYAMGQKTIEVWRVTGDTDFPMQRMIEVSIERGLIGRFAAAKHDNTIAWVGDDKMVYRLNGYTPQRISNEWIERLLEDTPSPTDIVATSYNQDGHDFLGLRSESGNWSVWYDAATQFWHERATYDDTANQPWDLYLTANCYNKTFAGSISDPNVYQLVMTTYSDNGTEIIRESVSPIMAFGPARFTTNRLSIDFVTGVGLHTGQGSDPQVMVQFSDDGGRTWSNEMMGDIGEMGAYKTRVNFDQLGQTQSGRIYKIKTSDPVFSSLSHIGWADIEVDDP
jgi:hypothetical protein